jgi:hypothetical protein
MSRLILSRTHFVVKCALKRHDQSQNACRWWRKSPFTIRQFHVSSAADNKLYGNNVNMLPFKTCSASYSSEQRDLKFGHRTYGMPLHQRMMKEASIENEMEAMKASTSDLPETDRFGMLSDKNHIAVGEIRSTLPRERKHTVKREPLAKKRQIAINPSEDEWTGTFGTLSGDVDDFLTRHTNLNER